MARDPRGKQQKDGPLAGHFRRGQTFTPGLIAFPETILAEWVREDLPDMLWPLLLVARHGENGLLRYESLQQAAINDLGSDFLEQSKLRFDGRLTPLNRIAERWRSQICAFLEGHGRWCPDLLRDLASVYHDLPGAWLIGRRPQPEHVTSEEIARITDELGNAVMRVASDEHLSALVKITPMTWSVVTRSGTFDRTIIDLLMDYPTVPEKHARADVTIGASFMAMKGAEVYGDPAIETERATWAEDFWRQSSYRTSCRPEEWLENRQRSDANDRPRRDASDETDEQSRRVAPLNAAVETVVNDFIEYAMGCDSGFNPYRPAQHEVVTGLFSRAARAVGALVEAPQMWNGEHGMGTIRLLAETEILLTWMPMQDPEVYEKYRNFGRGKRKLLKLQLDDLLVSMGSDAPQMLRDAAQQLESRIGDEWTQSFQPVSLEPTFSGITWRQMAQEADLADLYRYVFQPASGVIHGEWWTIEDHAMQRCLQPLHLFHLIPSFAGAPGSDREIAEHVVRRIVHLSKVALKALEAQNQGTAGLHSLPNDDLPKDDR